MSYLENMIFVEFCLILQSLNFTLVTMGRCEQCITRQLNSLKSLSNDELVRISNCKISRIVKKGEFIFEEGDTLKGIYCIREGICKLTKLSSNGKDQIIKLVVKGELLGQRSLINDESVNLSAVALNDMELCFIPRAEIMNDLHDNPEFSFDLLKQMAQGLKEADNLIVNMAQKSVRQRLAETLIYINNSFGIKSDGTLSVLLSREDFANIIGTATESTIRVLSHYTIILL